MSQRESLVRELTAAFPPRRPASIERPVRTIIDEETALTAAEFADKDDWTQLDWKWLDQVPDGMASALSFLSDEAICFYIPAYIIADLNGALEHVDPVFHLTHGFDASSSNKPVPFTGWETWRDYATRRWSYLSSAQVAAIARYLQWRMVHPGGWVETPDIDAALSSYWSGRAGAL